MTLGKDVVSGWAGCEGGFFVKSEEMFFEPGMRGGRKKKSLNF